MAQKHGPRAGSAAEIDPRVERSMRVVREAALEELADAGYGGFTIDGVSKRSGVARTTIYRHWPDKLALIRDALESLNVQPGGPPDGTPRERIRLIMEHLAVVWRDGLMARMQPSLIQGALKSGDVAEFLHDYSAERRGGLVKAIKDGIKANEVRADVNPELAAVALAGAVLYKAYMTPTPFTSRTVRPLVDAVLGSVPKSGRG